jgi:hypothetical protein
LREAVGANDRGAAAAMFRKILTNQSLSLPLTIHARLKKRKDLLRQK